jgi:hypothetical protein
MAEHAPSRGRQHVDVGRYDQMRRAIFAAHGDAFVERMHGDRRQREGLHFGQLEAQRRPVRKD